MNIKKDILDLIGNTPMVYLDRFCAGLRATVAAKLEMFDRFYTCSRLLRRKVR